MKTVPATHPQPAPSRASFFRSFVYAWNGLWHAIRTQRNARIHAGIAIIAITLGFVLHISPVEFAMVFVAITGVFIFRWRALPKMLRRAPSC